LLLIWLIGIPSRQATAEERIALLVGNQAYKEGVGPLRNPHNDVTLVANALDKLGFKVTIVKDAGYKSIDTALKTHIQQVRRAGKDTISFFYYSGHGASDPETRINYLIPVDVESADDANLWTNSFELNDIVSKLREQAPEATHYVVFDACRDELRLVRQGKKALGAVPALFTTYAYYNSDKFHFYGEDMMKHMMAYRTLLDAGIPVCAGSDFTAGALAPLMGIQGMVTRKGWDGTVWGANQRITIDEALRVYTINGAHATFEEHDKGSITEGKLADFVMLADDPHTASLDKIKDIKIEQTFTGGKKVHQA